MWFARYTLFACALACTGSNPAYRPRDGGSVRPDATDALSPADAKPPSPDLVPPAPDLAPPAPDVDPPQPDGADLPEAPPAIDAGDGDGAGGALQALVVESGTLLGPIGGTGGDPVRENCAGNGVLIGYEITSGNVSSSQLVVGLRALCGALHKRSGSALVEVQSNGALGPYGNPGASPFRALCPANEVVVQLFGREGSAIDQVGVRCARLTVDTAGAIRTDPGMTYDPVPSTTGGDDAFSLACDRGWVARGHHVSSSFLIEGFGVVCGRPRLP